MNEESRRQLRSGIEAVVRAAMGGHAVGSALPSYSSGRHYHQITTDGHRGSEIHPPLTTAQQLALSVLLGDDIPLGVLLSACEDAGVFADGLAGEIAEKAMAEEREQGAIAAMMLTLTRADELRSSPHHSLYEAATLDDHAAWLRDRMMERA